MTGDTNTLGSLHFSHKHFNSKPSCANYSQVQNMTYLQNFPA